MNKNIVIYYIVYNIIRLYLSVFVTETVFQYLKLNKEINNLSLHKSMLVKKKDVLTQ